MLSLNSAQNEDSENQRDNSPNPRRNKSQEFPAKNILPRFHSNKLNRLLQRHFLRDSRERMQILDLRLRLLNQYIRVFFGDTFLGRREPTIFVILFSLTNLPSSVNARRDTAE